MRKTILVLLLFFIVLSSASAALDYRLDLLSFDGLYKEYLADRDRASLDFQYANVYSGYPEYFYQNRNKFEWTNPNPLKLVPFIGIYHIGESLSVMRNTFSFDSFISPISFDFTFSGAIIGAMEGEIADNIGYDGVFFYGANARIADMVSFRVGYSHHCSHYGDGSFRMMSPAGNSIPDDFDQWFKYYRSESVIVGLSVEPFDFLRVYGEINFNQKSTYVMPYQFSPTWAAHGGSAAQGTPDSYGAKILNFGLELKYPFFKDLGNTKLSYHVRALEEGKIVYKTEELAANGKTEAYYDANRPWEFEHTINIAQELNEMVSLDITWHMGRFILNSYFATRSSYVSIGARLSFDGTVKLIDTAK